METQNIHLDFLIDTSFQEIKRLLVLSYEDIAHRTSQKIEGRKLFGQSIRNNIKTYKYIKKIITDQVDHYTTGYVLD